MKLSSQSRLQLSIQKFIFLLLFISTIGMLAWVTNNYTYQFDLTANKRHSLSNNSIELLKLLDHAITINAYTSDEVTKQAVLEIIARYQRIKNDFNVRLLNPDIDIEQVQADGIVMNKPFAFVVYYKNRMEHIDSLSEQAISNALLRLVRRENQRVVFLSGHGEREITGTDNRAYSVLNKQLIEKGINIQPINLLEQSLPDNTKILVIAAPVHEYLEGEIKQINHFIQDGGNLLWLADPGDLQSQEKLATSFGLQFQDGVILDNNPELRNTLNIQHPAFIPITEYFPHIITNTLHYHSLFPIARGISPLTNENTVNNWQASALFSSSDKSWSEAGGLQEEMVFNASEGDVAGPITIAVALQRNFEKPEETKNTNDETMSSTPISSSEKLTQAQVISQRVVVIGDSDFLSDSYIGTSANLNLGLNIFNWLLGDDDYISVAVTPSPDTRLALNDMQLMTIAFGYFLVIPLLLLTIGFTIWYKRKNR